MQRPRLNLKTEIKVNKIEEEEILKQLFQETMLNDNGDFTMDVNTMPTILPVTERISYLEANCKVKEEKPIVKLEMVDHTELLLGDEFDTTKLLTEDEIKQEMKSDSNIHTALGDIKIKPEYSFNAAPNSVDELLSRSNSCLYLLQLPDTLPGQVPETLNPILQPGPSAETTQPLNIDPASNFCHLNHLEEGLIGKIVHYKSGKAKLILGDIKFDLTCGTPCTFLQEVISVTTNVNERSGEMINLGEIKAKLIATPDWEDMLGNGK